MHYLIVILAFGFLIGFHEWGHFVAARLLRIGVSRFALGFGPAILTVRRKETEYVLGALPLGGSVQIHGMNPHEEPDHAQARSFSLQRPWKRVAILVSGPVANHLLAIAALSWLYISGTRVPVPMTLGTVEPGSAAARTSLRPGDRIVTVNGKGIGNWDEFADLIEDRGSSAIDLVIVRNGEPMQVSIKPQLPHPGAQKLGLSQQFVFRSHPWAEGLRLGFRHANEMAKDGFAALARWLRGRRGLELSSALGISGRDSAEAAFGFDALLRTLAALSVAVAVFNLLPIPALDGGRLLFVVIESVTGKPVNPKLETLLHTIGFLALLALLLLLAYRDLKRFFP